SWVESGSAFGVDLGASLIARCVLAPAHRRDQLLKHLQVGLSPRLGAEERKDPHSLLAMVQPGDQSVGLTVGVDAVGDEVACAPANPDVSLSGLHAKARALDLILKALRVALRAPGEDLATEANLNLSLAIA